MASTPTKFWTEDISALFKNYKQVVPTKSMTKPEFLNTMTRLCLLVFVILALFSVCEEYIYVPLIILVIIVIIYYVTKPRAPPQSEQFISADHGQFKKQAQHLSKFAPFTPSVSSSPSLPHSPNPKPPSKKPLRKFNYDSHRSFIHDKPLDTRRVSSQSDFAEWAYSSPPTCKEDPASCQIHEDIRFSTFSAFE